jgi:hypothetical protein
MRINNLFEADYDRHVTFCFGRFNPPTLGHELVFKTMGKVGGDIKIFTSMSQDKKKNPLDYATKIEFLKKLFPQYASDIVDDSSLNTIMKVAQHLYDQGYTHATFVGGSDRIEDMKNLLKAYNGVEGKNEYYKFETLDFKSSGEREDGAEGTAGISATAARGAAANNDLSAFMKATGAGEHAEELFAAVKQGMGIVNNQGEEEMKKENIKEGYDHPQGAELSRMGRILMDKAVTTKDDALSNVLARVGDELTRYGAPGGASSIEELVKKVNLPKEKILKLMQWAKAQKDDSLSKVKDPSPSVDDMEQEGIEENTPIGHTDDERNMLRKNLYQLAVYAKETFHMLEDLPADADFPHWWQAKVVNSLALMSKAKHYLENELNVPDVNGDRTEEDVAEGNEIDENVSRQHFQYVADVLKDIQDPIKRAEYAQHHSAIFQHFNPRFDHARFMAAAGVETKEQSESVCSDCGKPRFAAMPESIQQQYESVNEEKQKGVDGKVCWKGYKRMGTKMKGGKRVDNCVKIKK